MVCVLLFRGEWYFPAFDSGISRKLCSQRYLCLCVCVCIRGLLAAVHFLGVKVWIFHLGLAFLRSCFVSDIILYYYIFVWRVRLFVFFCFSFL